MSNNYKIKDETLRGIWSSLKTQATKCGVETDNIKVEDYHTLIDNLNVSEYTDYDGESPAYEQSVPPTSKPIAKVKMVGGKSRKVVQLLNNENGVTIPTTSTGISYLSYNSFDIIANHKYLLSCYQTSNLTSNIRNSFVYRYDNDSKTEYETGAGENYNLTKGYRGWIFSNSTNLKSCHAAIWGHTLSNECSYIKPQIFDLTEMYGAGNEPTTVEEFKKDFPNEYYGYTEGAIKHAQVDKFVSESANMTDWDKFKNIGVENGTKVIDNSNRSITITSTSSNNYVCFTKFSEATFGNYITVKPNTKYTLSWECTTEELGLVMLFENGSTTNYVFTENYKKSLTITTSNNATFLTYRFGAYGLKTITYSNIQLQEGDKATPYLHTENQIPTSVISKCTDYGVGINDTCYNYIDFVNKKYHRKVGSVDMGTLSWGYNGTNFNVEISDRLYASNTLAICGKYNYYGTVLGRAAANENGNIYFYYNSSQTLKYVYVCDTSYTDAAAFKTAMSGQILYYELATEQIIDLSDVLDDNFYRIKVEEGGTLTFHHPEADNGYIIEVPNQVTYKVNLDEIEASLTSEYANSLTEVI